MRLSTVRLSSCLVALAVASSLASAGGDLRWRSGERLDPSPRFTRELAFQRLERAGTRHVVVRFAEPPTTHQRALWHAAGLELGQALGGGAYFAHVAGRMDAVVAGRLPALADVREVAPRWKLHPALQTNEFMPWTEVGRTPDGRTTVALYVLLHADQALERADEILTALGGRVFDRMESVNGVVAFVPSDRVNELAANDAVSWIEPSLPKMSGVAVNDSNRALTQVNTVQAAPYSLDGSGVKVLVYDGGTALASHLDFGGRLTARDFSGTIDHATHVSATIGGSGAASGGTFRGMAPGVTIESYGFEYDGLGQFLFTNPGDFEDDYAEAITVHGCDIANNSIGSNVEPNGYICLMQGDYGVMSSLIDGVVRGSLGAPILVCWANGNERGGSRCDVEGFGDYYSTAPPATAKNHITVGALNSNDDTVASFSSWGPTDDGRMKPDVSAPGCQSDGEFGVTSAFSFSNTAYGVFCGTSMASPTVCGISSLLLQDYRAHFGAPDPTNATLKVLLAHTAFDLGNAGPDYQTGYGSVRAKDAIDFMRLGQGANGAIGEQGSARRWTVSVDPGDPELRITMAWDDVPAAPNVLGSLVNDLDLVVRDPSGTQHHVWTLNPTNPGAPAAQTQPNRLDNIEQVRVTSPVSGTWVVEVRGYEVNDGPQAFSIVSSHPLTSPPFVDISFPSGLPTVLTPGVATTVNVRVTALSDTLVGGSPTLHVRYSGGPFLTLPLSFVSGNMFQGTLPPPVCSASPEFFFSAAGLSAGTVTNPPTAPAAAYPAIVVDKTVTFDDDFETDQGWTVANVAVADGPWERAIPAGDGARGDPPVDFDATGAGRCFVTDNGLGNSDVDGGPTRLVSPMIDMSSGDDFEIGYARWFAKDDADPDAMLIELSNNNGASWVTIENLANPNSGGGWLERTVHVNDHLAPTAQMRLRVSVTDNPNDSVTEGGLDAVQVRRLECPALNDCNLNGILASDDIASGRSLDVDKNQRPDECDLIDKKKTMADPTRTREVQVP